MEKIKVRHALFGEGTAIDQRHHGHEYLVRFTNSLQLWLKKQDLDFLGMTVLQPEGRRTVFPVRPEITPKTGMPKDSQAVVEAFRLGIVPVRTIRDWTVGRGVELEKIHRWLQDESSGTLIIRGEYGSGKSHLLEYLHAGGFELTYAVSMVGLDPCDAQPGFPKRVYRHFIRNLRVPFEDHHYTFREIMTLIAHNSPQNPLPDHLFLGKILDKIKKNKDTPEMWDWIEGQEINYSELGTLYDHTTAANIYSYILSGISALVVKELNLRGLLLLLDEAETSRTYRYAYEWNRAMNFFNALSLVANDEPDLEKEEVVRGEIYYYGKETKLIYSGFLQIPYLYQPPTFLKVVFAFTPDFKLDFTKGFNIYEIELEPLPAQQMEALFYQFIELYESMYQTAIPKKQRRRLFELIERNSYHSTRRFIKAMVECLDFFRFYPSEDLPALVSHVFRA